MKTNMHYGASPAVFAAARRLRNNPTHAEEVLWSHLRENRLGIKFRRQHPLASFVVDFYCHAVKLVIELDGGIHEEDDQKILDLEKENRIKGYGLVIIRYTNEEVVFDTVRVVNEIFDMVNHLFRSRHHKEFE